MGEWFLIQWLSTADPRFRTSSGIRLQKTCSRVDSILHVKKFVSHLRKVGGFLLVVGFTNKAGHLDISEIS